ncbi:hypothetical protein [Rufibacter sp. LB8]|uniref:hypothetical protein n=1 Tax=Rufibacter sp. LB8 TaxID=2777781 RepID=UPI00178C3AAC|nr:hypothetical protein [Rufibacter sp. LB8]
MPKSSLIVIRLLALVGTVGLQFLAVELFQLFRQQWGLFLLMVGSYVLGKLLQKRAGSDVVRAIGWGVQWAGVVALVLWVVFMLYLAFFY